MVEHNRCPSCDGETESVLVQGSATVGGKLMLWAVIAVTCGFGPLTGGLAWLFLLLLIPGWIYFAYLTVDQVRCTQCGQVSVAPQQPSSGGQGRADLAAGARSGEGRLDPSRLDPTAVVDDLIRLRALLAAGVLSDGEAESERKRLIATSVTKWTDLSLLQFFAPATAALEAGRMTPEDGKTLKVIYGAVRKGAPGTPAA